MTELKAKKPACDAGFLPHSESAGRAVIAYGNAIWTIPILFLDTFGTNSHAAFRFLDSPKIMAAYIAKTIMTGDIAFDWVKDNLKTAKRYCRIFPSKRSFIAIRQVPTYSKARS
ncbi:hypothetical protein [Pseudomonas migulae]